MSGATVAAAAITSGIALATPAGAAGSAVPLGKIAASAVDVPHTAAFTIVGGGDHGGGVTHAVTVSRTYIDGGPAASWPGRPGSQAGPAGGQARPASGPSALPGHVRTAAHPSPAKPAHPHPCASGSQVRRWVCQAEEIMIAHGTPRALTDTGAGVIVAMHESGGNPRASNNWDSNATAGTPSEGIAQIIGPGFAQYHLAGHDNIWNPVDNMVAAFRYAVSRYGSMSNIPGVVAVRSGGAYVGY